MVTPGALIGARREFLIGMRDHQRGVDPNHDGGPQIAVSDPRWGDLAVPCGDQRPHVLAGGGPRPGNLAALRFADLVQSPPQGRIRGDRAVQLGLVAQGSQIRHHPTAIGDEHRGIGQHPAPIVNGNKPAADQRPRQSLGQAGAVDQQPQHRSSRVINHVATADVNGQILRP
jgi:hypothetical protein